MLMTVDKEKMTLASFFAGVGGIELGFEQTNHFQTIYANEFNKNARITYSSNFDEVSLDARDIQEVESTDVPDVDVITGGFPCQAFSIAGYRKGFEDERGNTFFELLRIIQAKQPRVIFIENVKNLVGHDQGKTFKIIREALALNGYFISWRVLNSTEYGNTPQNRERIYIVGFRDRESFHNFEFPEEIPLETQLEDIIDYHKEKDEVFYYREGKQPFYKRLEEGITSDDSVYQWRRQYVRENKSQVVPTLTANMGTGGHNVPIVPTPSGIRKLTPRETFNAQGFPSDYVLPEIANSHLYMQAGNSVVVPVVQRIAEKIQEALVDQPIFEEITSVGYAISLVDIHGRYSGTTEIIAFTDTYEEAQDYIKLQNNLLLLFEDGDYLRLIKNGNSQDFYMIHKV